MQTFLWLSVSVTMDSAVTSEPVPEVVGMAMTLGQRLGMGLPTPRT